MVLSENKFYESLKDLEGHAKVINNSEFVHNDSFDIENAEIVILSDKVDDNKK